MHTASDAAVPYEAEWRQYRRWNRVALALLIGWLPFGAAVMTTAGYFSWSQPTTAAALVGYVVAIASANAAAGRFPCPRCHHMFFYSRRPWWRSGERFLTDRFFTGRCRHCGLPKWAGSERRPLSPHQRLG